MASKTQPTNADIYQALGGMQTDLKAIHEQVKRTNGRVTALEDIEKRRSAVEAYIDKEGSKAPAAKQGFNIKDDWFKTVITALLAIIGALVGAKSI